MATGPIDDLVILAADRGIHETIAALLNRYQSLHIQKVNYQILSEHAMDSKCFHHAPVILHPYVNRFAHALVLFDCQDCGGGNLTREFIEKDLEGRLSQNGWNGRASVIALDPELEIWVWSDSTAVDEAMGWKGKTPSLRQWLLETRLIERVRTKPNDPKKAYQEALKVVQKKPSSSIFKKIAETASLTHCSDPAFLKLKSTMQSWFPIHEEP